MEIQKLSVKGMMAAWSVCWGIGVLFVALVNWYLVPGYGKIFLDWVGSIYPGYDGGASLSGLLTVSGIAFLDGAIGGLIFAIVYNLCARCSCCKTEESK